jgi:hypothetical protein
MDFLWQHLTESPNVPKPLVDMTESHGAIALSEYDNGLWYDSTA